MRHRIRRTIEMIMLALLLPLWPAGDADAQFNGALRGEYDVSVQRTCASAEAGVQDFAVRGTLSFDGITAASFTGQFFLPIGSVGPGMGGIPSPLGGPAFIGVIQGNLTGCTGTYTVNADGTFSQSFNCNFTFTTGPNAGESGTLNNITTRGKLAHDGTTLVIRNTDALAADAEVLSCPGCNSGAGLTFARLCAGVGVATSRR